MCTEETPIPTLFWVSQAVTKGMVLSLVEIEAVKS
jgi:hypothetical protein